MEYIGSLIYDRAALEGNVRFVIYGNGKMGRKLFAFLENSGRLEQLDCICDGDKELWGKRYRGIPILPPEEAVREKKDCHFLTAGRYAKEQVMFLQRGGIKNIHVIVEL